MSKEVVKSFAGKRALITGASSGLGLEFADLLAAQKVNLVLAARRLEPMEKLAADLRRKYNVDVLVEAIDLASPGAAGRLKRSLDAAAGATASPLLRLLTMKPRPVAASGIAALSKGRAMVVAGLANKMAAFSNRLTPRSMQRATMRKIIGP